MFRASFLPNQSVEDADINAIGENIAEAEYPVFVNGETYGVDALNGITAQLVTAGVKRGAGDNCAVSLSGTTALIKSGVAFFDSGVVMTIDDDGISVEREDSTQNNYVFLFYDPTANAVGARCAVSIPTGVEYVLLAEISASGVVSQNVERFCKSKVLDAPNTPLVIYNTKTFDAMEEKESFNYYPQLDCEKISVPDLSKYAIGRVTYSDIENYCLYFDLKLVSLGFANSPFETFGYGLYNEKIVGVCMYGQSGAADASISNYTRYDNADTISENIWCDKEKKILLPNVSIGRALCDGSPSRRDYVGSNPILFFDFEKDVIILGVYRRASSSSYILNPGVLKIELFAGEVQ